MKICPRCKRNCLQDDEALNSLSHIDNKTYICSECGKQSGLCDTGMQDDIVEIHIQERFKEDLLK